MNPRLYIAAHALQGLIARRFEGNENNGFSMVEPIGAAVMAVEYADALIAELAKTSPAAAASTSATAPAETAARGQEVG